MLLKQVAFSYIFTLSLLGVYNYIKSNKSEFKRKRKSHIVRQRAKIFMRLNQRKGTKTREQTHQNSPVGDSYFLDNYVKYTKISICIFLYQPS